MENRKHKSHLKFKVYSQTKVDILNSIIPPRDWNDSLDKLYIQYVSHQPASREDVI